MAPPPIATIFFFPEAKRERMGVERWERLLGAVSCYMYIALGTGHVKLDFTSKSM
jgi:hypothetical protein